MSCRAGSAISKRTVSDSPRASDRGETLIAPSAGGAGAASSGPSLDAGDVLLHVLVALAAILITGQILLVDGGWVAW